PGCYVIINGSEKVVIAQERTADNKAIVSIKKDGSAKTYVVKVNSKSYRHNDLLQIVSILIKKDEVLTLLVPIFMEIPIFIIFRALGVESDRDIIDHIVKSDTDYEMINILRTSLDKSVNEKG